MDDWTSSFVGTSTAAAMLNGTPTSEAAIAGGGETADLPSVTPERKHALLLEARRDRLAWIDSASLPYRRGKKHSSAERALSSSSSSSSSSAAAAMTAGSYRNENDNNDDIDEYNDGTAVLRSARACATMLPSAVHVVASLYGVVSVKHSSLSNEQNGNGLTAREVEERIRRQLESLVPNDEIPKAILDQSSFTTSTNGLSHTNEAFALSSSVSSKLPPRRFSNEGGGVEQFITSYREFSHKLRSPECADFVQGMRHFVRSLEDMSSAMIASSSSSSATTSVEMNEENEDYDDERDANAKQLAEAIHSYLTSAYHTMSSHPRWTKKKDDEDSKNDAASNNNKSHEDGNSHNPHVDDVHEDVKHLRHLEKAYRSLESFIYAKCYDAIWSVLLLRQKNNEHDGDVDAEMEDRISSLQFVTPEHLEIRCLMKKKPKEGKVEDNKEDKTTVAGKEKEANGTTTEKEEAEEEKKDSPKSDDILSISLADPVQSLRAIDDQYSPAEKLKYILDMYRGINAALHLSMSDESSTDGDGGMGRKNLPGADDVLPTVILTVLRAKPKRIVSNLRFIELFATPEQMRGEAGYAYTNLYGAVQFIRDLDLDHGVSTEGRGENVDGAAAALSISTEEFRAGLEKCRAEARAKAEEASKALGAELTGASGISQGVHRGRATLTIDECVIPVSEIRAARLRGEEINFDWALRWHEEHRKRNARSIASAGAPPAAGEGTGQHETDHGDDEHTSMYPPPLPLPQGFTRSYTFLGTEPDDIRVSDLPQLLQEYHMLVHATESLIAERTARYNAEHKRKVRQARNKLESDAAMLDAALNGEK